MYKQEARSLQFSIYIHAQCAHTFVYYAFTNVRVLYTYTQYNTRKIEKWAHGSYKSLNDMIFEHIWGFLES